MLDEKMLVNIRPWVIMIHWESFSMVTVFLKFSNNLPLGAKYY